jgi:hypothetical protein
MPIFAILFMVVFLLIIGRFFGSGGGFCGRTPMERPKEDESLKELIKEIRELKEEIRELRKEKREEVSDKNKS